MGRSSKNICRRLKNFLPVMTLCFIACAEIDVSSESSTADLPDMELFNAEVKLFEAGNSLFTVKSNKISQIEKIDVMLLDGDVVVDIFNRNGEHTAVMNSDRGEVLNKENRMKAIGNVEVVSDSGMTLIADELIYNQDTDRISSEGFVTVITPSDSLSGYGFSAASDLSDWVIKNTSGTTWRNSDNANNDE